MNMEEKIKHVAFLALPYKVDKIRLKFELLKTSSYNEIQLLLLFSMKIPP